MDQSRGIAKYWGRIFAVPCLVLLFALNFAGLNLSATGLGMEGNVIGLVLVVASFLMAIRKYSSRHDLAFRITFIISVALMQAFLGSALHDWFVSKDMVELNTDFSFVFIIPSLLITAQLWGWLFDRMRNRSVF
ncbi:MAG: hypothetical protein IPO60_09520 [Flavobacteriales bacterium]|nr:hypothetical protein [Flavobacteriales bacterium]